MSVLGKTDIIKREAPSVDGLLSYISDQPNGIFTPVNEDSAAFSANPVMHLLKFKMQDQNKPSITSGYDRAQAGQMDEIRAKYGALYRI